MKSIDIRRNTEGEGNYLVFTDTKRRKHGEQIGFGTLVVHAVNDECLFLDLYI